MRVSILALLKMTENIFDYESVETAIILYDVHVSASRDVIQRLLQRHNYPDHLLWIILSVCEDHNLFRSMEFTLQEYKKHSPIPSRIIPSTIRGFEIMTLYGWIPGENAIEQACLHDDYAGVEWLIEHGYRNDEQMIILPDAPTKLIKLCHTLQIPGEYQSVCISGKCAICRQMQVLESWEMDTEEYTHVIQWIPREIMQEVCEFI